MTSPIESKTQLLPTLTLTEKELLCHLDVGANKKAKELQQQYAEEIARLYDGGYEGLSWDPWKAHDLRKKVGLPSTPPDSLTTDDFHTYHGWFNGLRLLIGRIGRIFTGLGKGFLPTFFGAFGLTLGITFLVESIYVLYITFKPGISPAEKELNIPFWQRTWRRFKNCVTEDGRAYRLMNDSIWFAINLTAFILTGPFYLLVGPVLNSIGFFFDASHEFFWLGRHTHKQVRLANKLTEQIKVCDDPEETQLLTLLHEQTIAKRNEVIRKHLWIAFWTAVVFVGMLLVYFPPTTIPGAFLIGAGTALIAGSLFTGLGRRIYLAVDKLWHKLTDSKPVDKPAQDSTLNITQNLDIELKTFSSAHVSTDQDLKQKSEPLPDIKPSTYDAILTALSPSPTPR